MSGSGEIQTPKTIPQRGQILFAVLFLVFTAFLALTYTGQTTFVENTNLFAQPGFWPGVSVAGMAVFLGLHALTLKRWRIQGEDWREAGRWVATLEYAVWFLLFVWLVPRIGYIFASVLFMPALSWRMGYRSALMQGLSVGFAISVVVLFKGFLDVMIPGGAIYDYFPSALRSFFILNL